MTPRRPKHIHEQMLDNLQMGEMGLLRRELGVKRQNGTRARHAISGEFEFVHGVNVGDVEFDTGSSGGHELLVAAVIANAAAAAAASPTEPEVSILPPLATLQEHDGVTASHLGDLVDGLAVSAATVVLAHVELALLLGVRGELAQVLHEVAVAGCDAAGGDEEEALLVVVAAVGGGQ